MSAKSSSSRRAHGLKPEQIVQALIEAAGRLGLAVRWERGAFRGGRCTLGEQALIVLNRRHPPEIHLAILAESLRGLPLDAVFLRPAVRQALEAAWAQRPVATDDADGL